MEKKWRKLIIYFHVLLNIVILLFASLLFSSFRSARIVKQGFSLQMNIWKIIYLNCGAKKIYSFGSFTFYGYITNSQSDQLPHGLIAHSVEHCTVVAEVMGSNPVQAWIFFQALISQLLKFCV